LIGSKLGELVPYLEYFDLITQFRIWASRGSDLRAVLSVRPAAVLGDRTV
jgi:hypothetical protein